MLCQSKSWYFIEKNFMFSVNASKHVLQTNSTNRKVI